MRPRGAAGALAAAALLAGCGTPGVPKQLPKSEGSKLAAASIAILGACQRGPLTRVQEEAIQPKLQLLIDATKKHPDTLFEYPQEDQNPLLTTPSLELQAVVGALGGVGPQKPCSMRLAAVGDRGLVAAGEGSMLSDMPSAGR